ncbi:MAG: DUF2608 domain-containing protein [Holosporaceae bacterium]|jgi:hypothetical protein|nr:DUF2608 domain-containing protein [Holosporaceae bacterium]
MIKLIRAASVSILLAFSYCEAKMVKTDKIADIEIEFAQADDETLVIIDCDGVLIEPVDNVLKTQNARFCFKMLDDYAKKLKETSFSEKEINEEIRLIMSIGWKSAKQELLNKEWPELIKALQSRGIKVVLLSACGTGGWGVIKSTSEWRYDELLKFGIDFKKSWLGFKKIVFSDFGLRKDRVWKGYPVFENGMLLSANEQKGDVLKAFLAKIPQYKFKKIIFIDDHQNMIESVQKAADDLGIKSVCIEYVYASTKKFPPLDEEKAKKQGEILCKERRWVSDEEIQKY